MKKTTRILFLLVLACMIPIFVCIIYLSGSKSGLDDISAKRELQDINSQETVFFDDEAIALSDSSAENSSLRNEAIKAFKLMNAERTASGLSALVWSPNLEGPANVRAEECSVSFSHTRPNGNQWYTVDSNHMGGENLAYGYSNASSAMNAWMESQTHRENILWPDFTKVAISIYLADDGTYYWSQEFGY